VVVLVVDVVTVVVLVVEEVVVLVVVTVPSCCWTPGTLAAFAGSEPRPAPVRSRKPSRRGHPIRTPLPGGTRCTSAPGRRVAACPRRVASVSRGSLRAVALDCSSAVASHVLGAILHEPAPQYARPVGSARY